MFLPHLLLIFNILFYSMVLENIPILNIIIIVITAILTDPSLVKNIVSVLRSPWYN